jgi:hypothetical protein
MLVNIPDHFGRVKPHVVMVIDKDQVSVAIKSPQMDPRNIHGVKAGGIVASKSVADTLST